MADEQKLSQQRFGESLFWYINGTLDAAQRAYVERYLAEHTEARRELENWQTLQVGLRTAAAQRSAAAGLDGFMRRVQQHSPGAAAGVMEQIVRWLRSLAARPALATACALVLVQAGIIAGLLARQPASVAPALEDAIKTRSLGASAVVLLKVKFKPSVKVGDVDALFADIDASVVEGPALGYFTVKVSGNPVVAIDKIKSSALAQDVIAIAGSQPQR
jgi:anti-sigma factor RsiW